MKHLIYIAIVAGIVCGALLPRLHVFTGAIVYIVGFILVLNFFEIDFKRNQRHHESGLFRGRRIADKTVVKTRGLGAVVC